MKKFLFIVIALHSLNLNAQDLVQDRQDLQRLLTERATRFSVYTESLRKHSGIFGNKTKNDMKKSNEVLIEIVTTDNKIIDAMNRILNYRTFEKTNINYDVTKIKEKLQQSMMITDTLTKQLNKLELENKKLKAKTIKLNGLFYLSLASLLVTLFLLYRRRQGNDGNKGIGSKPPEDFGFHPSDH